MSAALLLAGATLTAACGGRRGAEVLGGDASVSELDGAAPDALDDGASVTDARVTSDAEGADGAGSHAASCVAGCAAAARTGCPADELSDCVLDCEELASAFPSCAAALDDDEACRAAAPASAWSCDADGFAALAACDAERAERDACIARARR